MVFEAAGIVYQFSYKKVKNINLRITREGEVRVSAPRHVPMQVVEQFLKSRERWIKNALAVAKDRAEQPAVQYTKEQCLAAFLPVFKLIYQQFADVIPEMPELAVRNMKSRWGVCNLARCRITLNSRLMDYSAEALEYVIMHEFVHFLHADHQAGFHQEMKKRMPDYRERRLLLKT